MKQSGFLLIIFLTFPAFGDSTDLPVFSKTLAQAEAGAIENSGAIKASKQSYLASEKQADGTEASLYPKLTLDGTYFYETNVPQLNIASLGIPVPGAASISFGDYNNYNVGPTLTYTLFDDGQTRRLWESGKSTAQMRGEDSKTTTKQILLSTRVAYSKVQLSLKNLILTSDSLKLSQLREQDIRHRFRAGASSRLDAVNAKSEVLGYQLKFKQTQNDLSASIRDLLNLTGDTQEFDISRPWPKAGGGLPNGIDSPTFFVQIDALENSLGLEKVTRVAPDGDHPQIKSLGYAADASRHAADAQTSNLWPRVQLQARAEYMYPNGPILQNVEQNIFTVNLSMPLFEGNLNRSLAEEHNNEATAYEYQRQQKIIDILRDRKKAVDLLENLKAQEVLSRDNADQAAEAARLTYQSYRAGKQQYLDVETAHLRLLEAQVGAAQVQSNILNTLAQIRFLSSQTEE